jgi:hypothetical protein
MSIQATTVFLSNVEPSAISIAYAKAGDKVVSAQAISNNSAFAVGTDMSSYFESVISVDGQISQLAEIANGNLAVMLLIARGV